jgi:hypothetical protein
VLCCRCRYAIAARPVARRYLRRYRPCLNWTPEKDDRATPASATLALAGKTHQGLSGVEAPYPVSRERVLSPVTCNTAVPCNATSTVGPYSEHHGWLCASCPPSRRELDALGILPFEAPAVSCTVRVMCLLKSFPVFNPGKACHAGVS